MMATLRTNQWHGFGVGVDVGDGVGVGVLFAGIPVDVGSAGGTPPGVEQAVAVTEGVPTAVLVADGEATAEATTSVKKAALLTSTTHGGTPVGPVKFTVTRIILLRSAPRLAVETAKTAKPSEVVVAETFTLPSGHKTVATAEAG